MVPLLLKSFWVWVSMAVVLPWPHPPKTASTLTLLNPSLLDPTPEKVGLGVTMRYRLFSKKLELEMDFDESALTFQSVF